MPHCTQCGTALADDARFCPKCGQSQAGAGTTPAAPNPGPAVHSGLSENAAALLSYVLGWITGLIFLLIDRRPYVRFHAAQSLLTFGALHIILIVAGAIFGFGWFYGGWANLGFGALLFWLVKLVSLVLWIICMVKAYQGERFKVPITGDIAEGMAGR
jgi:uncharacterized membrane protein